MDKSQLTARQRSALSQSTPGQQITLNWYETATGAGPGQADADLMDLVRNGVLIPQSGRRGRYWVISAEYAGRTQ